MTGESLKIITNGYVVTCDPANRGGRYTLLIRNGRIAEISDSADLFTYLHPYAEVVDASGRLIVPGFVNAHFHSESLLLRARTQGLHFGLWPHDIRLQECSRKLVERSSFDDLRSLYLAAYFGHLKSGTTCVGEFSPQVDGDGLAIMLDAIDRTEVRSVVTLQNWDQITKAIDLEGRKKRFNISLGRPTDFTVYTFESLSRASRDLKIPLLAHLAEQREGGEEIRKNFQRSAIAVLRDFDLLRVGTVLVHLNHLVEKEVETLEELSLTATICARSAAFKQTGYPSLRHLAAHDVRLCLGTDWSNLDMVKEIQFLYELPLLVPGIRPFRGMELLRMATINGAHALGLSSEIGSIEPGKWADLVFFDMADVRLPLHGPNATADQLAELLVNHLSSKQISDVMINGEFYVTRGQIMTMSEEDVIGGFQKTCESFFPVSAAATDQRSRSLSDNRPRLVSFTFDVNPRDGAGFEEGHPTESSEEPTGSAKNKKRPTTTSEPTDPLTKPELSKNVKRIFGEEDDF